MVCDEANEDSRRRRKPSQKRLFSHATGMYYRTARISEKIQFDQIWRQCLGARVRRWRDGQCDAKKGYDAFGTDITEGYDYLTTDFSKECDWIITNPPFSLAKEFIERSLLFKKPFALLLKSQYWHSARRYELFENHAPNFVLPLTWRPDFTNKGNSLLDMMWCVWIYDTQITYYQPLQRPSAQLLDDDQIQMIF